MSGRKIESLFAPKAVAIVGVSPNNNRSTLAYKNLVKMGYDGEVYFVNPKYDEVHGKKCYKTIRDIPAKIDSVFVSIPGDYVLPTLEEAYEKGAQSAVVISSGFGEGEGVGDNKKQELINFGKEKDFAVCGPNCLGLISTPNKYSGYGFFFPPHFKKGNVGGVFQSGGLMHAIAGELSSRGVGLSTIVSSGNETVTDSSEYIEYLAKDPNTDVIVCFIEGIKNPENFLKASDLAMENNKPIVALKVGRSKKAMESAIAHTGSMTGSDSVVGTVFKHKGIIRVDDIDEMIETVILLSANKRTGGSKLAITTTSGGESGMYADLGEQMGIEYSSFALETERKLKDILPEFGSIGNPLDTTGNAALDKNLYKQCLTTLVEDKNVDIVAVSQMDINSAALESSQTTKNIVESLVECAGETDKPILCFTPNSGGADKAVCSMLMEQGIPLLVGAVPALKAIRNLMWYSSVAVKYAKSDLDAEKIELSVKEDSRMASLQGVLTERESQEILEEYDIPINKKMLVQSSGEAVEAAKVIGFPLVMKIESPDIAHKSDAGGVKLNIQSFEEVKENYDNILDSVTKKHPDARIYGISMEKMVEGGLELIVGAKVDPIFGPTVLLGAGGVLVELLRDFSTRLAPVNEKEAMNMIRETKISKLLYGYRGKSAYDIKAVANVLVSLSKLVYEQQNYIEEIEINPLLVLEEGKGCVAVDGLVVMKKKAEAESKVTV